MAGPDLPFSIRHHGMVMCNSNQTIYIIGGIQDGSISKDTWTVNVRDLKKYLEDPSHVCLFEKGPPLNQERFKLTCGSCSVDEKSRLVVAGGNDMAYTLSTVEYLDPDSNHGWKVGM